MKTLENLYREIEVLLREDPEHSNAEILFYNGFMSCHYDKGDVRHMTWISDKANETVSSL